MMFCQRRFSACVAFEKTWAATESKLLNCSDKLPNVYAQEESDRCLSKTVLGSHPIMVSQLRFCPYKSRMCQVTFEHRFRTSPHDDLAAALLSPLGL